MTNNSTTNIRFIFFDLGNVLLRFSLEKLGEQCNALLGLTNEELFRAIYGDGMQKRVECGTINEEEFYEEFCRRVNQRPPHKELRDAMNDIFYICEETQPFIRCLAKENFPRGILSNIGFPHWEFCIEKFPELFALIPENRVLSCEAGAMKPMREIYQHAFGVAQKAVSGIQKSEVLFIDDMLPNVLGAKEFGFDAIHYNETEYLAGEIKKRGLGRFW
ncbi:hydrolase phosphatase [Planctomycetales bacterium]|nr:hydrolase phosphatase [Planctomycetales bacterium]GHT37906.1 hydrolase phosphatase [Planctomycetales bacterium]